jgi:hypothetical protein
MGTMILYALLADCRSSAAQSRRGSDMTFRNSLAATAVAASLIVSPIAAQAAVAERASADVEGEDLRGGSPALLGVGLLVLFGVISWLIAESDDEDRPVSP